LSSETCSVITTQAQLGQTAAEIASASAKYDYQLQHSVLDYQMGLSH